jgi:NADH:ubiquinone oxidoreductase subunit 2 (subunit N)
MILTAALNTNLFFIVFIAILSSVISAVYYLVIIKVMCFDKEDHKINKIYITNNYNISSFFSFNISLISLMIVLFIFFDQDFIRFLNILL